MQIDKIVNYTMAAYNTLEEINFSNYEVFAPQIKIKEFKNSLKDIKKEIESFFEERNKTMNNDWRVYEKDFLKLKAAQHCLAFNKILDCF